MGSKISGAGAASAGLLKEVGGKSPNSKDGAKGISFAETLTAQVDKAAAKETTQVQSVKPMLKFSNHALERMNTRGIHFSPDQITKIEQGMQKANDKGAKETLFITDDSALIVSLKDNTVVTVMDKNMLRENVFTKIDSTVFV
ncbi:MAG: hypothetical protein KDD38_10870 [Bdellovibrionales bacterium]|nr:hypothetical protein [Bdellovibrionales bacterium]